ncbi:Drug resistance transporter, Bcr/CflA subfamily [Candidatus Filomicrobium marinum]|uniref:Bcr/CflA family efflux transporter n=2 Tax=Filomicrobium TaxID=119044 RepID=A0A0D6JKV5_9HYPH|nr:MULTISPECIES: multidrug effflux MFS transporter [Filomicrobium]MCV0371300.1 multidrug effflux MFS transporter [Filomicrobium sp.]CFX57615.1 Drug resistance transporter, Bcr/CflA subfamily [Candidatus Filomicrobium marinum]CPR22290.1 Drug resistance transporter, Bcr/CflA subfamily [Candidatus Filomicrobium marinum]SDO89551.1 MFS transporter, DHA1 family, bicyclomycin/chloramphenicol resistance protein [Filomicrobium insigne]
MNKFEQAEDIVTARPDLPALSIPLSFVEFVGLTAALMALTALSIDIMLPALPEIGSALGVDNQNDRQLVVILYMAGFAAGQLIYGPLSDRFGRRPVLLAGLGIFVAGTVAALVSQSFYWLLAARIVQGLGAASPRVIAMAIVRDLYSGRQMARVMSFTMMVFIIIPVFAPSIGQGLIHIGDWYWTFYALLAIGLGLTVWAGWRLPETAASARGSEEPLALGQSFKMAILDPQTAAYGIAIGFMFGCLVSYIASAQQLFVDVFHMGTMFPLLFGAVASTIAIASFTNARLVGRLGMRCVSHIALVGFLIASLCLAVASELGVATLPVFVILIATTFFLFGLVAPNFNALAMENQGHNAGMASSVVGSLSTSIGAVAGGLIGHAFDGSVLPLSLGFAGCSLIAFLIVLWAEGPAGLFGRNRPN